jgi:IMP dehydrogenase
MARIIGRGYSFDDVLIIPKYNTIPSRRDVSFKTKITRNYEIDMPIIASNMDTVCESEMAIAIGKLGGLGVIHRFLSPSLQAEEILKVKKENLITAAALGIKDYEERLKLLSKAGVNIIVLDIAHAHSKMVVKTLKYIKQNYPQIDVMIGNVASKEAARDFVNRGADAIKVGIGPGSMCTTRIMTGAGVPQVTAIMDVYESTQGRIPICADGGIRIPGDLTKAIGAGADTVMIGSVLAGTKETPGEKIKKNGFAYKLYRGMASFDAAVKKQKIDGNKTIEVISVEGEKTLVEYKGPIEPIIKKFLGGLASGMTYVGSGCIEDIKGKVDFIEISSSALKESHAHGLKK